MTIFDDIRYVIRAAQHEAEIKDLMTRLLDLEPAANELVSIFDQAKILANKIVPGAVPVENYNVEWIQSTLNAVAGEHLVVDGDYGTATRAAVKRFQQARGLVPDSWVGLKTMSALYTLSQAQQETKP